MSVQQDAGHILVSPQYTLASYSDSIDQSSKNSQKTHILQTYPVELRNRKRSFFSRQKKSVSLKFNDTPY